MAQINEKLNKLLAEVNEIVDVNNSNSAVWSLPQNKSVLIVKHKALEKVSAHLGMWFDPPTIIESNTEKNIVSLWVRGYIEDGKGKNSAWSIGEVSPNNTRNSYPYAMAEKRAIDRVILKLLGIHGDFYSSSEADEFEETKENEVVKEVKKTFPEAKLHKDFGGTVFMRNLDGNDQRVNTKEELIKYTKDYIKIYNFDYDKARELYDKNESLYKKLKDANEDMHKDLMSWISNQTKKEK